MTVSLRCDFDGPLPRDWLDRLAWCCRLWGFQPVLVRFDRTARGWHAVVTFGGIKHEEPVRLVAMQAVLGSDYRREAFNLLRAVNIELGCVPPFWRSRWNVLYERHSRPESRRESRRGTRHTK